MSIQITSGKRETNHGDVYNQQGSVKRRLLTLQKPEPMESEAVLARSKASPVASDLIMLRRLLPIFTLTAAAVLAADLDSALFERLEWRNIGPSSMGGRITSIAGIPGNPAMVYVATASGGLFKTVNSAAPPGRRSSITAAPFPSATSRSIRIIPTWSGWAPAKPMRAIASASATAFTRRSTAARRGAIWVCATLITFRASSSIR